MPNEDAARAASPPLSELRFSSRSSFDLSHNRITTALSAKRATGAEILDLTESNPTRAALPYDPSAILASLSAPASLVYEPASFGLPAARETVARHLHLAAERVLLTASTSEAYAFLFKLLCDPGDEVLVPVPSYPLFEHLARLESVHAVAYRLAYDGAWHIDLDSVRAGRGPRTRAIVVVTPNNPTGSYLKKDELAALSALGLPIVSDEVFAGYALRPEPDRRRAQSALAAEGGLVFALGGLSKLAALPQMKLAWTAVGGEAALVQAALARLEIIADAFLSVGAPVQHALPALLASRTRVEAAIVARTRDNLGFLRGALQGHAASVLDVEGGWYATLRLPRTRPEEDWALAVLEQDDVYVHPGHFFDFESEAYLVVSLLTPPAVFREGVGRLLARVDKDA
jgi:aspartate/methionine/tyrosine aminotransferase